MGGGGSQKASMIARKPAAPATAAKIKPIPKTSMFLLFLLSMEHHNILQLIACIEFYFEGLL